MPDKLWKQCKVPGCPGLTKYKYCDKHINLEEKDRQAAQTHYNKNIRNTESQRFYESQAWRRLRQQKLHQTPFCEICYKSGRMANAVIVDHIKEIRDGGAPLDIANLQCLCRSCHNEKTVTERGKRKNGG